MGLPTETKKSRSAIKRLRADDAEARMAAVDAIAAGENVVWDLGHPHWNVRSQSLIELALMDLANGLANGYPLCCVEEYALDTLAGRLSGRRRGGVPNGPGSAYVPCAECCRMIGREFIP